MKRIKIFDTTLRDGEQSPGCSMNLAEKLDMAKQLEVLGVDIIEAGFAIASPDDFESVRSIAEVVKNSTVASLARATKGDIDRAFEAVKVANHPRIHTFLATSDLHMKHKLKMSKNEVLQTATDMVRYAKSLCDDIEFSAEDASRSDMDFLCEVITEVIKAGATTINVPDTVGYRTPTEMYEFISTIRKNVKGIENVDISTHCHDDLGLAVANSLAAVMAGATQVECTVNGIGERAGNASLEEIVMNLYTRPNLYEAECGINTKQIYKTSKLLSTITGVQIAPNKSVVGANAFAHESGIHQHGVLNERSTYEIMTPESIGIPQNKMVLGKHSGKHAFEDRVKELGYDISAEKLDEAFSAFKALADKKKVVNDKDIEALIGSGKTEIPEAYMLKDYVVNSGSVISATATVKLLKDDEVLEKVETGSGPIDAAFKAVNAITNTGYEIDNYAINSVTEGEDALGEVVVKIKKDDHTITGRGLSTDIIEASIKAYINAINKAVLEL